MVELVYHDPSDRTGESPFDRVVREITEDAEALIACPYIGPDYLEDVIRRTDDWYLLTDVGEWLGIHGRRNREAIHEFLLEHRDRVRHVTDLHAKVVIGEQRALVGSANFTTKGLTGRTEMSILLDDADAVAELREWFETVWSLYNPPETERIEAYLETASSTPSPARTRSSVTFSSSASPGTASLVRSPDRDVAVDEAHEDSHAKLVARVSKAPGPEWIDSYFNLLDELISVTGLSNGDPRLVTSLPKSNRLPVSINNRYVLTAIRQADLTGRGEHREGHEKRLQNHHKRATTGFIIGADANRVEKFIELADYHFPFDPLAGEDEAAAPHYVEYIGSPDRMLNREFERAWLDAASREIARATASPYKRYHEPVVYEAARNREYRETVLREAFEQG